MKKLEALIKVSRIDDHILGTHFNDALKKILSDDVTTLPNNIASDESLDIFYASEAHEILPQSQAAASNREVRFQPMVRVEIVVEDKYCTPVTELLRHFAGDHPEAVTIMDVENHISITDAARELGFEATGKTDSAASRAGFGPRGSASAPQFD